MTPFYRFAYCLFTLLFKTFYHLKIEGIENIPPNGSFIIAANHVSYLDPPVVGISFRRQVFFMAKVELFNIPILSQAIRGLGAFPVVRETADRKAIKHALSLLKAGKIVGIFPEGGRSASGQLREGELGMALLVKQANVPVVPCALIGTYRSIKFKGIVPIFSKIRVKIGHPIYYYDDQEGLSGKEMMKKFTMEVMEKLRDLLEKNNQ